MLLTFVAKVVENHGSFFAYCFAFGILTVENPHRVFVEPFKTGFAKLVFFTLEIILQGLVIDLSAFGTAYGIDFKAQLFNTEIIENLACERNDFGVCRG